MDTFLRDNRLLPPILALLALFVFAWVLAGVFVGKTDDQKPVAHRSDLAQADAAGSDPAAPEVQNPNVDSYAAYRSKDPFREVLPVARTTPEGTTRAPAERTTTTPERTRDDRPAGGADRRRPADSDRDGLPDRYEATYRGDPNNPDTDGDGIPDGLDDSDGDGVPDGVEAAVEEGNRRDRAGTGGAGGRQGRRDDLLDSGGTLSPP